MPKTLCSILNVVSFPVYGFVIRYDTIGEFNVDSKAECDHAA